MATVGVKGLIIYLLTYLLAFRRSLAYDLPCIANLPTLCDTAVCHCDKKHQTRNPSWCKGKCATAVRVWRPLAKNLQQINDMRFPVDGK